MVELKDEANKDSNFDLKVIVFMKGNPPTSK